ncbi:hypothetical protein Pint_13712 [Pistacia integerrima]|uniref:Uncharacterized protein n=1 Tax=Pistacia integerrima TaxID=434235 RepID=A0ACC0Y9W1_9ROSI|nr:hypothetical protein Pint_13712 [Pistacia integerrima]
MSMYCCHLTLISSSCHHSSQANCQSPQKPTIGSPKVDAKKKNRGDIKKNHDQC